MIEVVKAKVKAKAKVNSKAKAKVKAKASSSVDSLSEEMAILKLASENQQASLAELRAMLEPNA